ncbi:MAG: hypothetical protein R2873_14025 [Caldilineaceae bacterium]|nr:hypothetical protein [Caldilineaceae bacterium]
MGFVIQFVADTAPYIYAVCGFLALLQLYRTWQSRAERRQAIFSLEREKALNDLYNIFISAMVILLVMGLTYFVSTTLALAVEPVVEETLNPQPQAIPLIPTPTNTPLPATPTPIVDPTDAAVQQETINAAVSAQQTAAAQQAGLAQPTPIATPQPQAPAVAPALCPDGRSAIVSPGNGAVVSGSVAIVGTAQHDQFSYYKLEFAPGSNAGQGYVYFDGGQSPVSGGLLGNLNSAGLGNGIYTIQLVVVDATGNYPQPCRVTLTVQN